MSNPTEGPFEFSLRREPSYSLNVDEHFSHSPLFSLFHRIEGMQFSSELLSALKMIVIYADDNALLQQTLKWKT